MLNLSFFGSQFRFLTFLVCEKSIPDLERADSYPLEMVRDSSEATVGEPDPSSQIPQLLMELATSRGIQKTFCPSEAARKLSEKDWRPLMPLVRSSGTALWKDGKLGVFQKGVPVDPTRATGPIRYGLPR